MKPLFTAAFKVDERTFVEIPASIVRMTNIRDGEIFNSEVTPDGILILQREEGEKT